MPDPTQLDGGAHALDPSSRTIEILLREVTSLEKRLDQRLDGMDRAVGLVETNSNKSPTTAELNGKIVRLEDLHSEKFRRIDTQISERDTSTTEKWEDAKVRLDAALQAAEKAVAEQNKSSGLAIAKAEAMTTRQMQDLAVRMEIENKSKDLRLDDQKERLARIESQLRFTYGLIMAAILIGGILVTAWK